MTVQAIPYLLIVFRFVAGPVVLALACIFGREASYLCTALLALGVLSDIFDGVIARRIGCATPSLRKLDSRADVLFWLCIVAAAIVICPQARTSLLVMAAILGGIEFIAPIVSWIRFRQEASTHHILSKIFGLGLWLLMSVLFVRGAAPDLQSAVFALGIASQLEAIAIMLVVPVWRTDIRGIGEALRLRKQASRPH